MSLFSRGLLTLAGLAGAGLPLAAAPAAPIPRAPLAALIEPRPGRTLVAGETATLEWAPGSPATERAGRAEEWEAFLSLDGGAHYAIRITPHLDRDLRRVSFRVPDLPTGDARILLRFGNASSEGDERRELACEVPQRFAIVRPPGAGLALEAAPALRAYRAGEPARPGEPGVSRWIEGSRRGEGIREVEALPPPTADGIIDPPEARGSAAALLPDRAPDALPAPTAAALVEGAPPAAGRRDAARSAPLAADILLLTRRRNE
jgi:hypothetical protein